MRSEECDWEASSSDEAEVVQAAPAKAGVEECLPQKMEIEEEDEPRPRRKKLQLGSAQILLLQPLVMLTQQIGRRYNNASSLTTRAETTSRTC